MTIEALSILIYGLLIFLSVLIQGIYASKTAGASYGFTNRENRNQTKARWASALIIR